MLLQGSKRGDAGKTAHHIMVRAGEEGSHRRGWRQLLRERGTGSSEQSGKRARPITDSSRPQQAVAPNWPARWPWWPNGQDLYSSLASTFTGQYYHTFLLPLSPLSHFLPHTSRRGPSTHKASWIIPIWLVSVPLETDSNWSGLFTGADTYPLSANVRQLCCKQCHISNHQSRAGRFGCPGSCPLPPLTCHLYTRPPNELG